MRAVVGIVALALAIAVTSLRPGEAEAHPAALAARAAQIASKAAQAARAAGRASRLSRMTKMMQKARKGMSGMKAPGSLNRMRDRMRKSMMNRRFDHKRASAAQRHSSMRKLMERRTMNTRHTISTFAKRQLQNRSFRHQLTRRNGMQSSRLAQIHRNQQRRSNASNNTSSAESQRSRMRRNASSSARRGGIFASALAR